MVLLTAVALVVGLAVVALLVVVSGGLPGNDLPAVAAAPAPPPPLELRDGRSLGSADAPVHIEVYEDPQCPACAVYVERIEPLLVAGPVAEGRVRLTYRDFLLFGPESLDTAVGMRVADELGGRVWDFHDIVFANQAGEDVGAFSRDRLATMAELVGLDRQAFLARLDDPELVAAVRAESEAGRSLGVDSTPTLVINGQVRPGVPSWEELSAVIDELAGEDGQG